MNTLKQRLMRDEPCLGLLVSMPSPHLVRTLARAGLDWVFIDMEHGPISIESTHGMIGATAGTDCTPIVRVPTTETWVAKAALDAGAFGLVFPMVNDRADAEASARAIRYPPAGQRGVGPLHASLRWGLEMPDYIARANDEILNIVQIEHKDAVANIDDILAVEGIDVAFIAPFDLSMSLGIPGQVDHPDQRAAVARAEEKILESGLILGGLALSIEAANDMIARGYRLLLIGVDIGLIGGAVTAALGAIKRRRHFRPAKGAC